MLTAIHGWFAAHEEQISEPHEVIFTNLEMLEDWRPQVEVEQDEKGWDYADYVFDDPRSPSERQVSGEISEGLDISIDLSKASRGGYSGCPVWRMWKTDMDEKWEYILTGMAIYQFPRDEQGKRKLRVHREKSIERITGIKAPPYYKIEQTDDR